MNTKTNQIFSSDCPFDNSNQTTAKRVVFVCSVGMLRSPTAQMVATRHGLNARAAGSCTEKALIPLNCNLIQWAHKIVFMNDENFDESMKEFAAVGFDEDIKAKAIVWDITDSFNWGDNVLWGILEDKMKGLILNLSK